MENIDFQPGLISEVLGPKLSNLINERRLAWDAKLPVYNKMYEYYKGNTDAQANYKIQTSRSNLKVRTNYMKKFIKEEVSYSVGNDITYISKSSNEKEVQRIDLELENLSEQHDIELHKTMSIFNLAYELYYIDTEDGVNEFKAKVIPPTEGFVVKDSRGVPQAFVRIFKFENEKNEHIDVYTKDRIYHFNVEGVEEYPSTPNIFGFIPISIARVGNDKDGYYDSIYYDIKGLQDGYETNFSDIVNEISDFRNAYLMMLGVKIDDDDADKLKEKGLLQSDNPDAKIQWLIKNINDTFIKNTREALEDKMYQLTSHINHNEKMQSNLSGIALRSRLISLEERCKLNQRALTDCIKTRIKALFVFVKNQYNEDYNWKDIKVKFTPNIPQDDIGMADLVAKLRGLFSDETLRTLFSFCENSQAEGEKVKAEEKEKMDNMPGLDEVNNEENINEEG